MPLDPVVPGTKSSADHSRINLGTITAPHGAIRHECTLEYSQDGFFILEMIPYRTHTA